MLKSWRSFCIFLWNSWLSVSIISFHYILGYLGYISIQKDITTIWGFPKMVYIPQNTPIVNHFFVGKPMVLLGKPTVFFGNTHIFTQFAPLGGGFKYFLCSSLPGEMIQFDEHIFQMGWFNHQLDPHFCSNLPKKRKKNFKRTDFLFRKGDFGGAQQFFHESLEVDKWVKLPWGPVMVMLSYWDVLPVLRITGLVHPNISRLSVHPLNRWNNPTY